MKNKLCFKVVFIECVYVKNQSICHFICLTVLISNVCMPYSKVHYKIDFQHEILVVFHQETDI